MTLQDLIQEIESIAKAQPSVQMVVENDVYKLNERADARYGVFSFTQETHSTSPDSDYITYNLILYYIDRLTDDERNEVEVQSTGVQVLGNILTSIAERVVRVGDYNMQPFRQRFADVCAGVYARVAITTLKDTLCAEVFEGGTNKPVI